MKRFVYAFDHLPSAREAVVKLREAGIPESRVSIVARSDIEMDKVPDRLLDASMDVGPAVGRGALMGGATGVVAGLIAAAIPPLGIAIAGSTLFAFFTGGALLGAWTSSIVGASVPDKVRRTFEEEIKQGHVLVVVDAEGDDDAKIVMSMGTGTDRHLLWQSEVETTSAT